MDDFYVFDRLRTYALSQVRGIFRGFLEAYSWYDDKNRRKITKKLAKAAFKDPAPPVLKAAVRKS